MTITITRLLAGFVLLISVTSSNAIPIHPASHGLQPKSSGGTTIESRIAGLATHRNDAASNPDPPAPGNQELRVNKDDAVPHFPVFGSAADNITLPTEGYDDPALHRSHTTGHQAFHIGDRAADSTFDLPTPAKRLSWHGVFSEKPWSSPKAFARWVAQQHSRKRRGSSRPQSPAVDPHAVPEGGASVYLLGVSLIGLGALWKCLKMQGPPGLPGGLQNC